MYLGNSTIVKMYLGSDEIQAKYLGNDLIYGGVETYAFKFTADNYVDTGLMPEQNTIIQKVGSYNTLSDQREGQRTSFNTDATQLSINSDGKGTVVWGNSVSSSNIGLVNTDEHTYLYDQTGLYIDGNREIVLSSPSIGTPTNSLYLGSQNNNGSPLTYLEFTAKSYTLTVDGVVYEFTPDKDTSSFKDQYGNYYPIQGTISESNWIKDNASVLVTQGVNDVNVIPDSFNTGLEEGTVLTASTGAGDYGDITLVESSGKLAINCYSSKYQTTTGELVVEGYDFSDDLKLAIQNTTQVPSSNPLVVRFKNCKLGGFDLDVSENYTYMIFEHCVILGSISNSGFEAKYNYCGGEGSIADAFRPLRNFHIHHNYIADKAHVSASVGYHTDGVQMYGYNGIDVEDGLIEYNRFDLPDLKISTNVGTYVNAALMLQLEFSNAINIHMQNNWFTAGGFDVYSWSKIGTGPWTFTNCSITDNQYGVSHQYGTLYNRSDTTPVAPDPSITITNLDATDTLLVSTVEEDKVVVTNYIDSERTLRIVTNLGTTEHTISENLIYSEIVEDVTVFSDFPFDNEIVVTGNPDYIICYDVTDGEPSSVNDHIRFVNFSGEPVYI